MCKIIVMANQKGGVAKTSSTRNLAYSLAELGKKVLAVDFDPQTNLTISFGVAPAALQETTASLMMKLVMDEAMPEKGKLHPEHRQSGSASVKKDADRGRGESAD